MRTTLLLTIFVVFAAMFMVTISTVHAQEEQQLQDAEWVEPAFVESLSELYVTADAEVDSELDAELDAEADTEAELDEGVDAEAEAELDAEAEVDAEAEAEAEVDAEAEKPRKKRRGRKGKKGKKKHGKGPRFGKRAPPHGRPVPKKGTKVEALEVGKAAADCKDVAPGAAVKAGITCAQIASHGKCRRPGVLGFCECSCGSTSGQLSNTGVSKHGIAGKPPKGTPTPLTATLNKLFPK